MEEGGLRGDPLGRASFPELRTTQISLPSRAAQTRGPKARADEGLNFCINVVLPGVKETKCTEYRVAGAASR